MRSEVLEKIRQFEEKRSDLLKEVDRLDSETLNAKPIDGKWSILEIVEHLVIAEREVLEGLPEFDAVMEKPRTLKSRIMYKVVMFVLKSPIRVKVPAKAMNPNGNFALEELRESWDQSQTWFKGYVDQLRDDEFEKPVFEHPVAGGLSVIQALDMSSVHIDLHRKQIQERLSLLRK